MNNSLSTVLVLGAALVPALAQQNADEAPLVANAELDSYAIAEQLYAQARNTTEPISRGQAMARAAQLFDRFVNRFPNAANRDKALYLQAVCQAEGSPLGLIILI